MQKKNLLPLLLTVPALPAMANVDLTTATTAGKWAANGISNVFSQDENGSVTASVANGVISQTVNLPYGNYKLVLNTATNCDVKVSGKNVTAGTDGEFEVTGTSTSNPVTISISSADKTNNFGFGNCVITLVEDYYTVATEKETALAAIEIETVQSNVDAATKTALASQLTAAQNQLTAINTILSGLKKGFPQNPTAAISVADLVKLYNDYIINNDLDNKIQAYEDAIDAYNTAVKAANAKADTIDANKAAQTTLLNELKTIQDKLDAFKTNTVDKSDVAYAKDLANDSIANFQTKLDDYKAAINAAYAADKLGDEITFASQATELTTEEEGIEQKFDSDLADYAALQTLKALKNQLTFTYNKAATDIQGLYGIVKEGAYDYKNIYDDVKSGWLSTVAGILTTCESATVLPDPDNGDSLVGLAGEKGQALTDTINAAIADMEAKAKEYAALVKAQNNFMLGVDASGNATRTGYDGIDFWSDKLTTTTGRLQGTMPKALVDAGYSEKVQAVEDAIKAYTDACVAGYTAHDLSKAFVAPGQEQTLDQLYQAIVTAQKNLETIVYGAGPIIEVQLLLNKANEQLASKIPAGVKENYESDVKEIQDAIDALTLQPSSSATRAIKTSITNLKTTYGEIVALQESFDAAVKALPGEVKDNKGNLIINIASKFNTTVQNIQDAINALTMDNFSSAKVDIENAIKGLTSDSDALYKVFTETYNSIGTYVDAVDAFGAAIDAKLVVLNSFNKADYKKNTYAPIKTAADKYLSDLLAAAAKENPQDCYDAAVAARDAFAGTTLTAALTAEELSFAKTVTEANDNAVKTYFQPVEKQYTDSIGKTPEPVYGYSTFTDTIAAVNAKLAEIDANIAAAATAEDAPAAYAAEDTALEALVGTIDTIKTDFATLDKSNANYAALTTQIANVQAKIDQATADNEASVNGGKEYFAGVIAALQTRLNEAETAIKAEHDAAGLKDGKMQDGINDKEKTDFEVTLSGIADDAATTSTNIAANNNAFSQQQVVSANTRTALQDLIDALNDHQKINGELAISEVNQWIAEIQKLINEDLLAADQAVTEAYGKGESSQQNAALIQKYDDILAAANKVVTDGEAAYPGLVSQANADLVSLMGWNQTVTGLNAAYRHAIENYNFFLYRLTNAGYEAALKSTLEAYGDLYDFSNQINDLVAYEQEFVTEQWKTAVIPAATWKTEIQDPANALLKAIEDREAELVADLTVQADLFYSGLSQECQDAISDAKAAMNNAGLTYWQSRPDIAPAENQLRVATDMYAEATRDNLARKMDEIANELDKVQPLIDLQQFANDAWDQNYQAATDKVADLEKMVSELPNLDGYLESEFTNALAGLSDLNTQAKADESLIDNFKSLNDQLKAIISDLQQYADECVAENDANKVVADQLAAYVTEVADLQKALDDFTAYANSLYLGSSFSAFETTAQVDLDLIKAMTEQFKGSYDQWKDQCDDKIDAFKQNLADNYDLLRKAELDLLNNWAQKVQTAYDNAFEGNSKNDPTFTTEDMKGYNDRINAANAAVVDLGAKFTKLETNDADFAAQAEELITELTNIYSELKTQWPDYVKGETTADVLAALNDLYDTVDGSISLAQEELEGYDSQYQSIKDAYTTQFETFKSEIDAIKAAYEAEGNKILVNHGAYEEQLKAVETAVAQAAADMKADYDNAVANQEKIAASDAQAAVLQAQLDELANKRADTVSVVEGYGKSTLGSVVVAITNFDNAFTQCSTWLETQKTAYALTDASVLPVSVETMEGYLLTAEYKAARDYADTQKEACYDYLIDTVNAALGANYIVDKTALEAEFSALYNRYTDLSIPGVNAVTEENYETVKATIDEIASIMTDAEELLGKVHDNTYVPGNVDMSADGQVTALDVQTLVYWIGESTGDGEQLYNSVAEEYGPVVAAAADIVGTTKSIDIADVTADIDLSLGKVVSGIKEARAKAMLAAQGAETISMAFVGEFDGVKRYALMLDNATTIVGAQIDVTLPSSARIVAVNAGERNANHEVALFEHNGSARLVIFSMANDAFSGNTGAIAYIDVDGAAPVFNEATLADAANRSISVKSQNASGIMDVLYDQSVKAKEYIFDAAGRFYDKVQRGFNIIRRSDGSVKKEVRK